MPTLSDLYERSKPSTPRSTTLKTPNVLTWLVQSQAENRREQAMTVRPIVVLGNPVLRNKARKVTRFDDSIRRLVNDMIETMRDAPGVGLAAPQIGVPLQVAVVEAEKDQVHVLV